MNRLVPGFALLAFSLIAAPMAQSQQRAPVTRGVTSSDIAGTLTEVRQQNARMNVDIGRLEEQIAQLNGKIETLQFLLSESRDEAERLQADDAQIGEELSSLSDENAGLKLRVAGLESDIDRIMQALSGSDVSIEMPTEPDVDVAATRRERTTSSSSGESSGRRIVSSASSSELGTDPNYQGSLGTIRASNLPGEAGPLFAAAKSRLLQFDYAGAEAAFREFLDRFSDDPQAGEAQYWLAETLFQQEAYDESGQAYTQMLREYPDNARAPDALVKLSRSMRLIGETEKACNALDILPQQYPNASGVTKNLASLERSRAGCDS